MSTRHLSLVIVAIGLAGCDAPQASVDRSAPSAVKPLSVVPDSEAQVHPAERAALDFIAAVRYGSDLKELPAIPVDEALSEQDRIRALGMLARFIKSQHWKLWFTSI